MEHLTHAQKNIPLSQAPYRNFSKPNTYFLTKKVQRETRKLKLPIYIIRFMFCITHLQGIPRKDSFENSQNKAEQVAQFVVLQGFVLLTFIFNCFKYFYTLINPNELKPGCWN